MRAHIDEVDHDEAAQVSNSELPRNLVGRLKVRVERRRLNVLALGRARGVDVDRGERLGVVDRPSA
jgi:hypothetical protein